MIPVARSMSDNKKRFKSESISYVGDRVLIKKYTTTSKYVHFLNLTDSCDVGDSSLGVQ